MNLHAFARRMPKAEGHAYLEGAIRPATLLHLARRNGVSPPAQDVDSLRDFAHFVEVWRFHGAFEQYPPGEPAQCTPHQVEFGSVGWPVWRFASAQTTGRPALQPDKLINPDAPGRSNRRARSAQLQRQLTQALQVGSRGLIGQ